MIRRAVGLGVAVAFWLLPLPAADAPITVSAAASLKEAFTEIGKAYETAHPGAKVVFNFGASGQLVQQVVAGAPADVLGTADSDSMDKAMTSGRILAGTRADFASNTLVLIVPAQSVGIASIADLGKDGVKHVALGAPSSVPAGRYAQEALELDGTWATLKDKLVFGENVRQVLDYVSRSEADAGFVYATDAMLMKDRLRVVGPVKTKRAIVYSIAVVKGSANEAGARAFVATVRSSAGQAILKSFGFASP